MSEIISKSSAADLGAPACKSEGPLGVPSRMGVNKAPSKSLGVPGMMGEMFLGDTMEERGLDEMF